MKLRHNLKKTLFIIVGIILINVVVIILFISPITKYLVEKYDTEYTGREITMSWAYVNPFTGYVHFHNLKVQEENSDSIFFSAKGVSANIAMFKLLSNTFELSKLTLNKPRGIIIQKNKTFNFDDLIKKFSPKKTSGAPSKWHVNILRIKMNDGEFHYQDKQLPLNYFIKKVNLESDGMHWNVDTISVKLTFLSGTKSGEVKGYLFLNIKNLDYRMAVEVHKFDLKVLEPYLKDITNYGSFFAKLDADMKSSGNFKDAKKVSTKGTLAISDFHFGKSPNEDYASFHKLVLAIRDMSPWQHKYIFDSISLNHPYFKYERYDKIDNIQAIFGKKGANINAAQANTSKFNLVIEIANYIKILSKNFFRSNYKINQVAIYNGNLVFNDYSNAEKFSLELDPIAVFADSIYKKNKRINVTLKSGVKPAGNISVALSINPKDSSDFDLQYQFQHLPASLFNPYLIAYTSYPLDRGTIELDGTWQVRNAEINSNNHLQIIDPRVGVQVKNEDTKWIPMWLIMSIIRDRGNVIDYQIPITGNLKSPKFHLWDLVFDALENIIVKPATTPYRMRVKSLETEIEKTLTIKWELRHSELEHKQESFMKKIADFLVKTPEAHLVIHPQMYVLKEKEYILFFEAKKKYFLATHPKEAKNFSRRDSITVDKMSIKDPLFIAYLDKHSKGEMVFTIQGKCARLIGSTNIDNKIEKLRMDREHAFMSHFKKKGVDKRVKISRDKNVIPYNGFSFYKIDYKNQFPASIIKAYKQMIELNNDAPRKNYKKERRY